MGSAEAARTAGSAEATRAVRAGSPGCYSVLEHPSGSDFLRSPWQNGIAERWVGSCRRDLPDHVIALNEYHLKRQLSEYVRHYHEDRTHLGLAKQTPAGRTPSAVFGPVVSHRRLGGCTTATIGAA